MLGRPGAGRLAGEEADGAGPRCDRHCGHGGLPGRHVRPGVTGDGAPGTRRGHCTFARCAVHQVVPPSLERRRTEHDVRRQWCAVATLPHFRTSPFLCLCSFLRGCAGSRRASPCLPHFRASPVRGCSAPRHPAKNGPVHPAALPPSRPVPSLRVQSPPGALPSVPGPGPGPGRSEHDCPMHEVGDRHGRPRCTLTGTEHGRVLGVCAEAEGLFGESLRQRANSSAGFRRRARCRAGSVAGCGWYRGTSRSSPGRWRTWGASDDGRGRATASYSPAWTTTRGHPRGIGAWSGCTTSAGGRAPAGSSPASCRPSERCLGSSCADWRRAHCCGRRRGR